MTKAKINRWASYKDISVLTPYESQIYNLMQEGFTYVEIAEKLNNRPMSIKSRLPAIREKIALQEINLKQANYPAL